MNSLFICVDLRDGPLIIALHNTQSPSEPEWQSYLNSARANGARQPEGKPYRGLVFTDGGAPGAKQRAAFAELMNSYSPTPVGSVITDSTLVRGVVTAIGWLVKVPRVFSPSKLADAFLYVGIPNDEIPLVKSSIEQALSQIDCKAARKALLQS